MVLLGDSDHRVRVRGPAGRCAAVHHVDVCGRQLQARDGLGVCGHHGEQERLGVWLFGVYYAVVAGERVCAADYDEYVFDLLVVLFWGCYVVLWEEVSVLVEE